MPVTKRKLHIKDPGSNEPEELRMQIASTVVEIEVAECQRHGEKKEEEGSENCPPVCASCLGCPRTSVVTPTVVVSMVADDSEGTAPRKPARASLPILVDDIPHIPLASVA